MESSSKADELRRRFAVWTLAIVGTFSGSETVQLRSSLWAAEEPPLGLPQDAGADTRSSVDEDRQLTAQTLQQLIANRQFDQAIDLAEQALSSQATDEQLRLCVTLASTLASQRPASADRLYSDVLAQLQSRLNEDSSSQVIASFVLASQGLSRVQDKAGQLERAIATLESSIQRVEQLPRGATLSNALPVTLALLLVEHERIDQARQLLSAQVARAKSRLAEQTTAANRLQLGTAVSNFVRILADHSPDETERLILEVQPQLLAAAEHEEAVADDYRAYQAVQLAQANSLADKDPLGALALLEGLAALADQLSQRLDETESKELNGAQSSLQTAITRTRAKLLHRKLVGQPAPEFQIEAVVAMPRVDWAALKGQVVLIDFWAVWCGPCIETFPHLRHLHATYADRGLAIVGVTRQFGYLWDAQAGTEVADKQASLEQELEMLEQFRRKHDLPYGFIVTPKGSDYNKSLGVVGIPQAVVVDQQGIIQLIVSGSSEKSAQLVEEKIKSLLEAEEPQER